MSSPSCLNPRWGRGFSLHCMQLSFYARHSHTQTHTRNNNWEAEEYATRKKNCFARAAGRRIYYFAFTTYPGSAVCCSLSNRSRINPKLHQHYEEKRGSGPLQITVSLPVSLWFVPLLWGSVILWHLQVTVAFIGRNTELSLSAEKNLAMIYLGLFYCWRWSRFSFPSFPPFLKPNLSCWACI